MPNNLNNNDTVLSELEAVVLRACDWCHEDMQVDDDSFVMSNSIICNVCYDDDTFGCYRCDERFHNDNAICINDYDYCQSCYENVGFYCESCSSYQLNDDSCDCESDSDMGDDNDSDSVRFDNGGERLPTRDIKLVIGSGNTWGVELEAEGGKPSLMLGALPLSAGIHRDGSLGDTGAEVVTPPLTMAMLEDYIPTVCKAMTGAGYVATKKCGLHIHCKPSELGMGVLKRGREGKAMSGIEKRADIIKNIVLIMSAVEPVIYSMMPVSRASGNWCQPLKNNRRLMVEGLRKINKVSDFGNWVRDRYFGVNLCALRKYGTVEFRYHSGTLDSDKIIAWAKIIEGVVAVAKQMTINKYSNGRRGRKAYQNKLDLLGQIHEAVTMRERVRLFNFGILSDYNLREYVSGRVLKFQASHAVVSKRNGVRVSGITRLGRMLWS